MKPNFALSLSFDGIVLLHRAAGGWRRVGTVSLDAPDLAASLADLRAKALALEPGGIRSKLIIPNDQIRYMSVETGTLGGDDRRSAARRALEGATPYRLDELAFDISVDGALTHVAAVAHETLAEAEAFAVDYRFNPISFVGQPGDQPYLGEPFFGPTRHAAALPGGKSVEPDGIAVVVIGDAELPKPEATSGKTEPKPVAAREPADEPGPTAPRDAAPKAAPVAGFSSRRRKSEDDAPNGDETPVTEDKPVEPRGAPEVGGATRDSPLADIAPRIQLIVEPPADAAPAVAMPKQEAEKVAPPPAGVAAFRSPSADDAETPGAKRLAGLLARLKPEAREGAEPARSPASLPAAPLRPVRTGPASPRIEDIPPEDETARMTVFGARATSVRGKPRHLGLILTIALLLFLAAVAAWASIFLDDGLAGLFRRQESKIVVAAQDASAPAETISAPASLSAPETAATPETRLASLPPANLPAPEQVPLAAMDPADVPEASETPATGAAPGLTGTDAAVLDALRDASESPAAPETEAAEPDPQAVESEALYAATGIWQTPPEVPETPAIIGIDDLYLVSIDRTDLAQDAVALPSADSFATDVSLVSVSSPAAAETVFDLGADGLVVPSATGTVSPEGVTVYLGPPPIVPPPTPVRLEEPSETDAVRERLAGLRPKPRPTDLAEKTERAQLGGLSREELGSVRPKLRPAALQPAVVEEDVAPTTEAVAASVLPKMRPKDLKPAAPSATPDKPKQQAAVATEPEADEEPESGAASTASSPKIPSKASVARQATLNNAINLSNMNLIGVYGTPSNRRALVRLPSGRYKKVKVGDTIDGGKVVAIGDSELRYQKGGRNMTLKIPSG